MAHHSCSLMDKNTLPNYSGEHILSIDSRPAHSGPELCANLPATARKLASELILRNIELRKLQMRHTSFGVNSQSGYELRIG